MQKKRIIGTMPITLYPTKLNLKIKILSLKQVYKIDLLDGMWLGQSVILILISWSWHKVSITNSVTLDTATFSGRKKKWFLEEWVTYCLLLDRACQVSLVHMGTLRRKKEIKNKNYRYILEGGRHSYICGRQAKVFIRAPPTFFLHDSTLFW